jgi:pimeloyl-ACP methyl ester carboxylesterase
VAGLCAALLLCYLGGQREHRPREEDSESTSEIPVTSTPVHGVEHWTRKDDVRLFLFEKFVRGAGSSAPAPDAPRVLFVHGSTMASQPSFDLQVPGRPEYSVMDYFARLGYDVWTLDNEGYGRSDKHRDNNADIATGADDLEAAAAYIAGLRGDAPLWMYGTSSGALKAGLFALRQPGRVRGLVLDGFVWTGEGSPTLANRRQRLDEYRANNRRPIDEAFIWSIFTRDHPGSAHDDVVDVFAREACKLDTSVPNGTYVDMCANLPLVDPTRLDLPVLILRGEWDGIAADADLLAFFARLPNANKSFVVLPGVAHASLHGKNNRLALHYLEAFFGQPPVVYRG